MSPSQKARKRRSQPPRAEADQPAGPLADQPVSSFPSPSPPLPAGGPSALDLDRLSQSAAWRFHEDSCAQDLGPLFSGTLGRQDFDVARVLFLGARPRRGRVPVGSRARVHRAPPLYELRETMLHTSVRSLLVGSEIGAMAAAGREPCPAILAEAELFDACGDPSTRRFLMRGRQSTAGRVRSISDRLRARLGFPILHHALGLSTTDANAALTLVMEGMTTATAVSRRLLSRFSPGWLTRALAPSPAPSASTSLDQSTDLAFRSTVGGMFVVSRAQLGAMVAAAVRAGHLPSAFNRSGDAIRRAIDVGAGDGSVLRELRFGPPAPTAEATAVDGSPRRHSHLALDFCMATEFSTWMTRVLQQNPAIDAVFGGTNLDEVITEHDPFDLVMCLNVLDRVDDPLALMHQLRGLARPPADDPARVGGLILLAVVLPFSPQVEGGSSWSRPSNPLTGVPVPPPGSSRHHSTICSCSKQRLPGQLQSHLTFLAAPEDTPVRTELDYSRPDTFERHAVWFVRDVLPRAGLRAVSIARAPYLSHRCGSLFGAAYLSDLLILCRVVDRAPLR
ncbi:hypothetical protein H696_03053 [Fonticula alba]|uniref:Methyltransferase domain-containing protein n=1 Tax=Fonticula alba TaxID=691883 RepID=A0A058Z8V4_FONAL|nr:hypothetical protein H696_03053 [Fonticula alba]KCV70700.1 hypothetical protein H696_03053 [Fonticula alba]|eukprot:XP_009495216.1 hypothetical protein H696_03053 [Fonticula alba]